MSWIPPASCIRRRVDEVVLFLTGDYWAGFTSSWLRACLFSVPLFINADKEFDERLLGERRMQAEATFKHGDKSGRVVFRKSADGTGL